MVLLIPSKKSAGNKNEKSTISTTSLEKVRRDQQRGDECCDIDGENKSEKCPLPLTYSGNHWSEYINENTISSREITESDNFLNKLKGGSDNNQFIYLDSDVFNDDGESSFKNSKFLNQFDIILEVKNFKISGYTFNDVVRLLEHLSKTDGFITLRTVKSQLSRLSHMNSESTTTKLLPLELNKFLEVSFRKDSIDHDLQQTIRDNVYERTVPCTTRPPRPGEVHGQDYVFLTNDEFVMLKNNSLLLEYGFYNGFMYGTPIPPPQPKPFNDKTNMCSKSLEINESKISGKTLYIIMFE
jgi:atrophin-1 interacting protein 1